MSSVQDELRKIADQIDRGELSKEPVNFAVVLMNSKRETALLCGGGFAGDHDEAIYMLALGIEHVLLMRQKAVHGCSHGPNQ